MAQLRGFPCGLLPAKKKAKVSHPGLQQGQGRGCHLGSLCRGPVSSRCLRAGIAGAARSTEVQAWSWTQAATVLASVSRLGVPVSLEGWPDHDQSRCYHEQQLLTDLAKEDPTAALGLQSTGDPSLQMEPGGRMVELGPPQDCEQKAPLCGWCCPQGKCPPQIATVHLLTPRAGLCVSDVRRSGLCCSLRRKLVSLSLCDHWTRVFPGSAAAAWVQKSPAPAPAKASPLRSVCSPQRPPPLRLPGDLPRATLIKGERAGEGWDLEVGLPPPQTVGKLSSSNSMA
ncbi:hypothetical protein AAY473_023235 [Plecturocebus cupreus]